MTTTPASPEAPELSLEDRIRFAAHQIWELEGMPEGKADEHWFKASEMVTAEDQFEAEKNPPTWLQRSGETPAETPTLKPEPLNIDHMKKRMANRAA
jgi:Protein of unknown function (DUF2934)